MQDLLTYISRRWLKNLSIYPVQGADLLNLVTFPPQVQPVPVKPLFLDVAWNYIAYPGRKTKKAVTATQTGDAQLEKGQPEQRDQKGQAKKGWFGFGR